LIVCKNSYQLIEALSAYRDKQHLIGFVPTMGALHQGHISLVERARSETDITVCSIFVNPTQFNDKKDFDKYPNTLDADKEMLEKAGCDILFLPAVEEIYPSGFLSNINVPLGRIASMMEAKHRPGHFEGVLQVVKLLLDIVKPDSLYMGAKDFQQCAVIKQLIKYFDLPVKLVICPTIREPEGLAMSSRNMRLTQTQRNDATILSHVLLNMQLEWKAYKPAALKKKWLTTLNNCKHIQVEYLEIVDADTLVPIRKWEGHQHVQACAAVFIDRVRLIDNVNIF